MLQRLSKAFLLHRSEEEQGWMQYASCHPCFKGTAKQTLALAVVQDQPPLFTQSLQFCCYCTWSSASAHSSGRSSACPNSSSHLRRPCLPHVSLAAHADTARTSNKPTRRASHCGLESCFGQRGSQAGRESLAKGYKYFKRSQRYSLEGGDNNPCMHTGTFPGSGWQHTLFLTCSPARVY